MIFTEVSFPGLCLQVLDTVGVAGGEGNRKNGGSGFNRAWRMESHLIYLYFLPSSTPFQHLLGLSVNPSPHPSRTLPGSPPHVAGLGCAFPSHAGLPLIPQKTGRFHGSLWPLVPRGRSYHFPVETGPEHWALRVLLRSRACPDTKHGGMLVSGLMKITHIPPTTQSVMPEAASRSEI